MATAYNGNIFNHTVNDVGPNNGEQVVMLPLNLIALIVSYLDDVADLARVCRTCRVLHYMTLPQLYSRVTLRSYAHIRYGLDERPEGCGSASPLAMGLNGLISRNLAGLVRSFKIGGDWKEYDLEEFTRVGRIPDNSMMLNMVIRMAVEKMEKLDSFSWELNTKMLQTVYQGLAQRPTLSSLTIKFPATRLPRPVFLIPPIPGLQNLKVTDIDPLCYPDDISLLLLGSKKLRDLRLHWSPRMREELELSINLNSYFGRCMAAGYKIPVQHIAFQNLYAQQTEDFEKIFDAERIRGVTMINTLAGAGDGAETTFVDDTWRIKPPKFIRNLTSMRQDRWSRVHCNILGTINGLESLYLLDSKKDMRQQSNGAVNGTRSQGESPATPNTPASASGSTAASLGKHYIDVLSTHHGPTLRQLLLAAHWRLGSEDIAKLVRSCPNLEQLGLGLEKSNFDVLPLLLPFLPKLFAFRLLDNPDTSAFAQELKTYPDDYHERNLAENLTKPEYRNLRWVGLCDLVFRIGKLHALHDVENGVPLLTRVVKRVPRDNVQDIEIWGLDSLEI